MSELAAGTTRRANDLTIRAADTSRRRSWKKFLATVAIAMIVGPFVGTVLAGIIVSAFAAMGDGRGLFAAVRILALTAHSDGLPLDWISRSLMLGYIFGGVQATVCGLIFGAYRWYFERLPVWVPIVVAVLALFAAGANPFKAGVEVIICYFLIHLVPAVVVWWLVRGYWKRADA